MTLRPLTNALLAAISAFGLLGPNGAFLYYAYWRGAEFITALRHPVTAAFVLPRSRVT